MSRMAEALELEELTEEQPAPDTPAEEQQTVETEEGTSESPDTSEPAEEKKEPKKGFLLPVLTFLLILVGIGEAVFWGYYGFSAYRYNLAARRYEEQQQAMKEERISQGITGGSSFGPSLKVENGTVTWKREEPITGPATERPDVPRREDGLRLSRFSVPKIHYTLADTDVEDKLPETPEVPEVPASGIVDSGETPTST